LSICTDTHLQRSQWPDIPSGRRSSQQPICRLECLRVVEIRVFNSLMA